MHYYKFNIGDYASHTQHLEPIEDIAYRRMLDWIYLHESPLPDSPEQIARLIRMRTHCEDIANVLREFFTLTDHGWMQEKASIEIDAYKDKSNKAKASAEARWAKKPENRDANALQPQSEGNANHKPLTINHKPLTKVSKAFKKPSLEEVQTYFHDIGSMTCIDDGERFFDHFTSNGWKVGGKTAMKDWKASVRGWHKRNGDKQNEKNQRNGLTASPTITLRDSNF